MLNQTIIHPTSLRCCGRDKRVANASSHTHIFVSISSIFYCESWMCFYRQTFSLKISSTAACLNSTCETGRVAQLSLDQLSHLKLSTLQGSVEPARTWLSVNVCCEASASNYEIHFRSTRLRSVQTSQYSGLEGFSPGWICSHFTERSLFTGWSPTGNSSFPWWLKKKKKKASQPVFLSQKAPTYVDMTHSLSLKWRDCGQQHR